MLLLEGAENKPAPLDGAEPKANPLGGTELAPLELGAVPKEPKLAPPELGAEPKGAKVPPVEVPSVEEELNEKPPVLELPLVEAELKEKVEPLVLGPELTKGLPLLDINAEPTEKLDPVLALVVSVATVPDKAYKH